MGKGGIIGKANEPTAEVASGMWSLREHYNAVKNSIWPRPITPTDPYFNYVTMLLQGDGTNGAQNNTFLDGSPNNFTITRNGNTTQGSFGPYGDRWSNYFSSDTQYINLPASTNLNLNGDFTIEAWVYKTNTTGKALLGSAYPTTNHQIQFDESNVAGRTGLYNGSTWQTVTCSSSPNSQWFHLAYVRSGTTVTVYLNGVSQGTFTSSTTYLFTGGAIGALGGYNLGGWIGYISNFRIVKGTAVYTGNFTPSITPLTAITNTQLLACQSNRFLDNSTNNFTLTPSSGVSVQPFSPFAPSAAYSTSVNGGSGYFDGTGDYLSKSGGSTALRTGSGNFTIEFWFNSAGLTQKGFAVFYEFFAAGSGQIISVQYDGTGANLIYVEGGSIKLTTSGVDVRDGAWHHHAIVRNGSTVTYYVDGVNRGTYSTTLNVTTGDSFIVGNYSAASGYDITGYMSDLRVVVGTAVYTANFTPPTAPLTAITNTSLLLNFTNAGVVDSAADNVLETVGNAQISTSVKKYGTGALAFDGSGDYLLSASLSDLYAFGSGNFTIEFWLYLNATQTSIFYDGRPISGTGATPTIYVSSNTLYYFVNNANQITGSALLNATWYHIAVCKSGTSTRMFVDGTQVGLTYTDNVTYVNSSGRPIIGAAGNTLGATSLNGYIDDLRVTKGFARYTANFTPPTAELPRQ